MELVTINNAFDAKARHMQCRIGPAGEIHVAHTADDKRHAGFPVPGGQR